MVRTQSRNDDESANDLTRFLRAASEAEDAFDDVDTKKVRSWFTAAVESGCGDDDFDGGDYVADDPVFVKVEVTIDVPNDDSAYGAVAALQKTVGDKGFVVEDTDWSGYFTAPVDTSGTFDQPAGGDRDAERYKVTVTGKRYVGGPEPEPHKPTTTPIEEDKRVGAVPRDF